MFNNDYVSVIRPKLSDYRFNHSLCVADRAVFLANIFGLDADKAYVAGILHDVMKEECLDFQRQLIESDGYTMTDLELNNKNIYHQMSGAVYVKKYCGITDDDIIGGIRYHTTGRADMTDFEMLIYLADFTSKDRDYPDVDIMRELSEKSFLDAMLYSLRYTIKKLSQDSKQIHPDTLHCYNWVLSELQTNRKEI